ncbi:MAG TPA: TlpA family protein disulfide reductase [Candidatus Marinimicrobia bacterium]|nr:TlpA family protein disulfide reductase [Candidatus Neomarinimicrobiota bacterium]HIB79964.1 TlpA family protein disulfide reductase [Candidatus Neomarinimicrobiota bacterium]
MIKMRIILWMTILIAIGCGQKEKMKEATRPSEIVNKMMSTDKSKRPDYAIKAPDFTLRTVQGELFKLSENRGKVIMLNFWGTWCGPCRREIPDFNKLHAKYQKDGLKIVGITITSGSAKNILDFMNDWDMEYTVLTDIDNNETQKVTSDYGRAIGKPITGIPTTLIIDQEGYIVKGYIGPRSEEVFYKDLHPLLFSS